MHHTLCGPLFASQPVAEATGWDIVACVFHESAAVGVAVSVEGKDVAVDWPLLDVELWLPLLLWRAPIHCVLPASAFGSTSLSVLTRTMVPTEVAVTPALD